ncbi:MAG: hypothetical protein A2915_02325 [Candidatus Yanofskybacteria bacterium RIFCSPLOWO2_01_FULL_41_34]|nr:MAG: hypothetical protein A2915_02325 [Candidatus Yanofskybacteria bacterium RIFCSPLOWO2_01_FULL_41_34]
MATGRTISASFLTDLDRSVIELCEKISKSIIAAIAKPEAKKEFSKEYGKISYTRDGGLGLGGGKLQRDAICTRGRQGKAPFSNRNLRWHPLVVAEHKPDYARKIERIEIGGRDDGQVLIFIVKDQKGREFKFPSDKVHEMPERFVALPEHWFPHIGKLKHWSDTLWTQNSCVIPALEACNWWDSVETYAVLGIALAVDLYGADFEPLYGKIKKILQEQKIDKQVSLPTDIFPTDKDDIVRCPVCRLNISKSLEDFRKSERGTTWQPAWRSSKKGEGEDSSIQIMHVNPLVESHVKHNASNVRYGHRWCNVAMTDHSLDETLDFMEFVIRAHNRCK